MYVGDRTKNADEILAVVKHHVRRRQVKAALVAKASSPEARSTPRMNYDLVPEAIAAVLEGAREVQDAALARLSRWPTTSAPWRAKSRATRPSPQPVGPAVQFAGNVARHLRRSRRWRGCRETAAAEPDRTMGCVPCQTIGSLKRPYHESARFLPGRRVSFDYPAARRVQILTSLLAEADRECTRTLISPEIRFNRRAAAGHWLPSTSGRAARTAPIRSRCSSRRSRRAGRHGRSARRFPGATGRVLSSGQVAGASDDQHRSTVRQRDAEQGGTWGVAAQDQVGRGDTVAGQRSIDLLLSVKSGVKAGIGVPDGGERVAGHAVADVHVALAGPVQREFARQRP